MRTSLLSIALFVVIVSCSATAPSATDAPPATAAPTSPIVTTDTVSPSSSEPGTTPPSTVSYPPGQFSTREVGYGPAPLPGSDGAGGSGCAPGTEVLPDGAWFGFVVDRADTGIQFDLACWWSGDRANEVALERGETDVPVPNDYYITNDSEQLRTVPITPEVNVFHLDYTDKNTSGEPYVLITFGEWDGLADYLNCDFGSGYEFCPVWLFVNDGVVTEMVEQYVP